MKQKTERQKVQKLLSYSISGLTPSQVAEKLSDTNTRIEDEDVIKHIEHIKKSLDNTERFVSGCPPKCQECGFERFKPVLNIPSKCPNCRSRSVLQPKFRIDKN